MRAKPADKATSDDKALESGEDDKAGAQPVPPALEASVQPAPDASIPPVIDANKPAARVPDSTPALYRVLHGTLQRNGKTYHTGDVVMLVEADAAKIECLARVDV